MANPDSHTLTLTFAEVAAGDAQVWYITKAAPGTHKVAAAYFVSDTARTANDTNYTDLSLEIAGTEIASEQTTTGDTGSLVAGTPIALALTGTGKQLELAQGAAITIKKTDAASGLALDGTVSILLTEVRI